MLTDGKVMHMLSVARLCQQYAKEEGFSDELAMKMFVIGYNHDIGYEITNVNHRQASFDMIKAAFGVECMEILKHGDPSNPKEWMGLYILNKADMHVNSKGEVVSFEERLADIKKRYGDHSQEFFNAMGIIDQIRMYEETKEDVRLDQQNSDGDDSDG